MSQESAIAENGMVLTDDLDLGLVSRYVGLSDWVSWADVEQVAS